MRILKVIGVVVGAIFALAIFTLVLALAINWRDVPASTDYRYLRALIADRPPLADADNGFVYLLGIGAAPDADPAYLGARRLTWLEGLDADMSRLNEDPAAAPVDFTAQRAPVTQLLADACETTDWRRCYSTFDAMPGPNHWSAEDRLLLGRYRALIGFPGWREHVGNDINQPIARYGDAISGQRLFLMSLRGADATRLRESLSRDHAFWRRVLASSDTLIGKMIAVSALRQHFRYGNLLLRARPAGEADAIPDGWRAALTRDELSVERVLAGELVQMDKVWRNPAGGDSAHPKRVPFFQPQDIANNIAAEYRELAAAFEVPLTDYARVEAQWSKRPQRHPFLSRLYDLGGDYLRQIGRADYETYPRRVAAIEAWRRGALTVAELRARGVAAAQAGAAIETAPLRNPFDGRPFNWSADDQALIYDGDENQRPERRRQVYVY